MMHAFFCAAVAALLPFVAAHGDVSGIVVGGTMHEGPFPNVPQDSPIRMVNSINPIKDVTSTDMICGAGAQPSAAQILPVTAGESVQFTWRSGNTGTPWPHNMGPIMTYMAKCPSTADKCDGSKVKWFKTDQLGQSDPNNGQMWFQALVMKGEAVNTTIPKDIEDGDYLIRHEILALHNAMTLKMAEFYVGCTQVHVTGGGGKAPAANLLVSFPGAYSPTDPGIHLDVYTNFHHGDYKFPGPALAFAAPGDSAGTSSAPPAKPTRKPGKCNVQKHRRAVSRVMRRLAPHELRAISA